MITIKIDSLADVFSSIFWILSIFAMFFWALGNYCDSKTKKSKSNLQKEIEAEALKILKEEKNWEISQELGDEKNLLLRLKREVKK